MQHLESCTGVWVEDSPLVTGQKKHCFQHLDSLTVVCEDKTPSFQMGRREVISNICSHALEFGWLRLPPCQWAGETLFATSRVMQWSLGGQDTPLASGQYKSRLQHVESCTGVWVGKTPPLLVGRRKVVCSIWSHAPEFGWVRLYPY